MPQLLANALLDFETGNMIEYLHLMEHSNPNIKKIWTTSAAAEFGRLF